MMTDKQFEEWMDDFSYRTRPRVGEGMTAERAKQLAEPERIAPPIRKRRGCSTGWDRVWKVWLWATYLWIFIGVLMIINNPGYKHPWDMTWQEFVDRAALIAVWVSPAFGIWAFLWIVEGFTSNR